MLLVLSLRRPGFCASRDPQAALPLTRLGPDRAAAREGSNGQTLHRDRGDVGRRGAGGGDVGSGLTSGCLAGRSRRRTWVTRSRCIAPRAWRRRGSRLSVAPMRSDSTIDPWAMDDQKDSISLRIRVAAHVLLDAESNDRMRNQSSPNSELFLRQPLKRSHTVPLHAR